MTKIETTILLIRRLPSRSVFDISCTISSHIFPLSSPTPQKKQKIRSRSTIKSMANHQGGNTGPGQPSSGGCDFRWGSGASPDGSWGYRWGYGSSPGGSAFGYGSGSGGLNGNGRSGGFGFGWGGGSGQAPGPNQNGFGGPFGFGFGSSFGVRGNGGFHQESWFGGFPGQQQPRPNGPRDVAHGGGTANARR